MFSIASGNPILERNKNNVMAFYDLMFNQSKPAEAMRLDDQGKIVEHWDVLQKVPSKSAHDNGMF